jgi:hypothetical protein
MATSSETITSVEDLSNFPFSTFEEFKKSVITGVVRPGVDRGVAYRWAGGGIHAPKSLNLQVTLLAFLPFLAAIGFIVFIVVTKSWLMLLTLPVLLIAFFVFHPSSAMIFGAIRSAFIGLSIIGFLYAWFSGKNSLMALTLSLVIIWYSQRRIYNQSVKHLIDAITQHEDLLCLIWQAKAMNLAFSNGNEYWGGWKVENGETTHYEKEGASPKPTPKKIKPATKDIIFCTNCGQKDEQGAKFCVHCGQLLEIK